MGHPVSGRCPTDGSILAAASVIQPVITPVGAANSYVAMYSSVGSASDQLPSGIPGRTPASIRYEKTTPGELVHVDIKKLGLIPEGGGH